MTKRFSIVAICLMAMVLSTAVFAQDPTSPQTQRNGRRHGGKLKKMDTNQDGQITRDEWKGRDRGFQKADRNNDGIISREEAMNGRRQFGKQRLQRMDADKDRKITRGEWTGDAETFGKLDKNNDGTLTRDEMKGRRRKGEI